ncbi:MAG: GNAT family N-acetyltransferase [Chloroflexota bacterium]
MSLSAGPAVHIRTMTGYDVEPLAAALGWPSYGIGRRWSECLAGHREMYVADVEGTPSASVSVNERPEFAGFLHLFALDVAKPLQSQGIGTRLIERVEDEARSRHLAGVYLEVATLNKGARRLYDRLGYSPDGKPFLNSWYRYDSEGNVSEEVVETVCRLVKRF